MRCRVHGVQGHDSTLRRQATVASCHTGGHEIWWTVDAACEHGALALLPFYVAQRTTATQVKDIEIHDHPRPHPRPHPNRRPTTTGSNRPGTNHMSTDQTPTTNRRPNYLVAAAPCCGQC